MNSHLKAVQRIDKITDCIPVVSTIKNVSIVLYQLAHKVDNTANPVTNTVKDDIKIVALSKEAKRALLYSIPIVGNFAALIQHGIQSVLGFFGENDTEYFDFTSTEKGFARGKYHHSLEIAKLYLARHKMSSFNMDWLTFDAALYENEGVLKLLFESNDWSDREDFKAQSISGYYCFAASQKIKDYLINHPHFNDEVAEKCFLSNINKLTKNDLDQLTTKFPGLNVDSVGKGLASSVRWMDEEKLKFILEKFESISEEHLLKAAKNTIKNGRFDSLEIILKKFLNLIDSHLDEIMLEIGKKGDVNLFFKYYEEHKEDISEITLGKILAEQTSTNKKAIREKIIDDFPNLSAEALIPALESAALHNPDLFKKYLNQFEQIKAEHLQELLNDAVFVHGVSKDWFGKRWQIVAAIIKEKFPKMEAKDPNEEV